MDKKEWIMQEVAEDAADGVTLAVPRPKTEWTCLKDGTRNAPHRQLCAYCGEFRERVER